MKLTSISILIKPSSSRCNLNCKYCFYYDVSKNRNKEFLGYLSIENSYILIDKLIDITFDYAVVSINFQGGEPLLRDISYYKSFVNYINSKKVNRKILFSLQTNGTLIDEKFARFFKENNFLIGISLDGFKSNNDYFRVDFNNKGKYDEIINCINVLNRYGVEYNILTVLTEKLSSKPLELYDFYKKLNINYLQIIPCIPELNNSESEYFLSPKSYWSFFEKFYEAFESDNKRFNVGLFNDIFMLFLGILPTSCGIMGYCSNQLVVEGNGDVYPCDFYVLDNYNMGNIKELNFDCLINNNISAKFISDNEIPNLCDVCRYKEICNGNCKRIRNSIIKDNFCAYQMLLNKIEKSSLLREVIYNHKLGF